MTVHAQTIPQADQKEHLMTIHQDTRNDPYYWMRLTDQQKTAKKPDAHTKQVLDYIDQENQYTQQKLAHTEKLQAKLFKEMTARLQKDKTSVPYQFKGYMYYHRYEKGKEYRIHYRKKLNSQQEEILLDENELAKGHKFFKLGVLRVSPNQQWIAYTTDTVSRNQYQLHFKNLKSKQTLNYHIGPVRGNVAWANDNQSIFYTTINPTTLLSEKIWRHQLHSNPTQDTLVYTEKDSSFYIGVTRSKSGKFIVIWNESTQVSDYHLLSADQPKGDFKQFTPRSADHLYQIAHDGNQFYIISNHKALNSKLMVEMIKILT